jgi:hypothetical protein
MTKRTRLVILSISVLSALSVRGQSPSAASTEQEQHADALKRYAGALQRFGRQTGTRGSEIDVRMLGVEAFPCQSEEDQSAQRSCLSARRAYYDYYAAGLTRRTKVYEWNNLSTRVIFVVVLGLVGIGVYFSWKQFFGVMRPAAVTDRQAPAETAEAAYTELEAGIRGIRVKSPVLGVVLLAVSLAFFYLYLVFVYPVTEQF